MIIICDESMHESFAFVATHVGYHQAYAKILEIVGKGHKVGGDVARVMSYCR